MATNTTKYNLTCIGFTTLGVAISCALGFAIAIATELESTLACSGIITAAFIIYLSVMIFTKRQFTRYWPFTNLNEVDLENIKLSSEVNSTYIVTQFLSEGSQSVYHWWSYILPSIALAVYSYLTVRTDATLWIMVIPLVVFALSVVMSVVYAKLSATGLISYCEQNDVNTIKVEVIENIDDFIKELEEEEKKNDRTDD